MNGKQLKNSILQWAIQGKLVPQDPNDEPASVLLEKIRAEKARLIKEGKIKKDKKESIIYRGEDNSYYEKFADGKVVCIDDEIPFEIPQGWEWCRFSSIYWQLTDGTHSTPKYTLSGIPFLSVKDMSTGRLSFSNTKFISEKEHKLLSQRCHPRKGDLLISKVGTTGIPLIIDDNREFSIFVSLALIKFFPKFIDSSFLITLLNSPLVQMQVKENTRGVGNKNWVLTAISNTLLVIPPLHEQQRIIEKIGFLNPYIVRYARSESKLSHLNKEIGSNLKNSILQEAIQGKLIPQDPNDEPASVLLQRIKEEKQRLVKEGKMKKKDIVDSVIYKGDDNKYYPKLPKGWVMCKLSDVCKINSGFAFSSNDYCTEGIPLVRISNIKNNTIDLSECVFIQNTIDNKFLISKGDLLIAMSGATTGKIGIYDKNSIAYLNQRVGNVKILSNTLLLPEYRNIYMLSKVNEILNIAYGGAQPNISTSDIENLDFMLPPLSEQKRIVTKVEDLWGAINTIVGSL